MYFERWKRICYGFVLTSGIGLTANAFTRIAVIDTGYNDKANATLCAPGHYDFTNNTATVGIDNDNHGYRVVKLLAELDTDYCLVISKVFNNGRYVLGSTSKAICKALADNVDYINMSMSGEELDIYDYSSMWWASHLGVVIFAAAGNENHDLDKKCDHYPACYAMIDNLHIVGSKDKKTLQNRGKVVTDYAPYCKNSFCGTSSATPQALVNYVRRNDYGL